jgi:RNA ligase
MLTHRLTLQDLRAQIHHKDEIRQAEIAENVISFCYMIAGADTFDTAHARECRGICFDKKTGEVIGLPLHKFFNVGERAETQIGAIDWSKVVRVMDKRDGSLISTTIVDGAIRLKSKKSFDSDVAKAAQQLYDSRPNFAALSKRLLDLNATAIFEYTAPDARIVLHYPEAELTLLHVRDHAFGTYWSEEELRLLATEFQLKLVDHVEEFWIDDGEGSVFFAAAPMLKAAEQRENIEGWIVQFENGDMVKVKTKWYLNLHRVMTFLRERDIAEAVLDETVDDLKSQLAGEGIDISEILQIERQVVAELNVARSWVEKIIAADGNMTRKDFALLYKQSHDSNGWFGLLMTRYSGKEPDYKKWYTNNVLKDQWSLRQLVLVPSAAEAD